MRPGKGTTPQPKESALYNVNDSTLEVLADAFQRIDYNSYPAALREQPVAVAVAAPVAAKAGFFAFIAAFLAAVFSA
jgi:hypothetical protein